MKRLLTPFLLCCSSVLSQITPSNIPLKTWTFAVQGGEANIAVEHAPGNRLLLAFSGPPCVPCISIVETSKNLEFVLTEMPAAGLDPHAVALIAMQIDEPEVRDRIAVAALHSKDWKKCMRLPACSGNEQLVDLLNQTRAYESLDHVFAHYGLSTHVVSAEKITVRKADEVNGFAVNATSSSATKIPVNGHLLISVTKIAH